VTVLRNGATQISDQPLATVDDGTLVRTMAGSELADELSEARRREVEEAATGEEILRVGGPRTLPLILRRGEIIGLAGLAGSGRSSILRQVYGMQRRPDLSINFEGQPRTIGSPGQAMRLGIAYVGEDRATQGIFANLPLRETVMTPVRVLDGEILVGGEDHAVEEVIERLEIRGDPEEPMESLSGGNQQKALFGRWILVKPKLFLLDEPTRGIDVRAKAQIHHLIRDLADKGASVLVVSSELPELLSLADRIAVIKDGQVTDILEGAELSEDDVLEAMSTISPIAEAV
jgi:ABC-type sugar transport system ATPase subunit